MLCCNPWVPGLVIWLSVLALAQSSSVPVELDGQEGGLAKFGEASKPGFRNVCT